jgi:hypothetical protein
VNMTNADEYSHQKPSCEYFVGIARGRGIKVLVPTGSDLLKTGRLYGFEGVNEVAGKARNELDRIAQSKDLLKDSIRNSRDERMMLMGAIGGGVNTPEEKAKAQKRIGALMHGEESNSGTISFMNGQVDVLEHFQTNWGFSV